jgi:type I restriction enzyme S subunit
MAADPYITTNSQTYSEFGLRQSKLWPPNTLCITIAGANTAKTAILKFEACFPDSIVGFIPDGAKSDLHFVKYSLDLMKARIRAVTLGATQDNLSLDKLLSFPILMPPPSIQRKIAAILSAYDDLIENNLWRIKILEEMAQLLYREWLAKFRFPGHEKVRMVDSPLGRIPDNWETSKLGDEVTFGKGRKPSAAVAQRGEGMVPILLVDALRRGEVQFGLKDGMELSAEDDTLMVMDGSGSCDVFIGFCGAVGSTLGRFSTRDRDRLSAYGLYLYFVSRLEELKGKNVGAAVPHANKQYILTHSIVIPSRDVNRLSHRHFDPLFCSRRILLEQNAILRQTRDLLLPKLISGKLDVSELDIKVPEEAA